MTAKQIEDSLNQNKLQLSFCDKANHFGIVIFCCFISACGAFLPKDHFNIYFVIVPALIGLLFYIIQSNRLHFKEIHTTLSRQELGDVIKKIGHELEWHIAKTASKYLIAKTDPPFVSGSWGEQITILFDKDRVLVNSICDPGKKSSVVSMGRNKKNMRRLIEEIEAANRTFVTTT
jgi:hypothetical protein